MLGGEGETVMSQWLGRLQYEARTRRIRFLSKIMQFKEGQRKEENEKFSMRNFLKKEERRKTYALMEKSEKAVSEDFRRWGLCSNCERHLLGKMTTKKPVGLICLGCLQSD
jgi:hypothetical protein